jgi:hypothetical protein
VATCKRTHGPNRETKAVVAEHESVVLNAEGKNVDDGCVHVCVRVYVASVTSDIT